MNEILSGIPSHLTAESQPPQRAKNTMGKDDFMKLLMTQLKNQDPLKPMEHQEFATQLAQFGQLEQLTNIGSGIKDLKTGVTDGSKLQVLGLIGKKIQTTGSEVDLMEGQSVTLSFVKKDGVQPMGAQIVDSRGKLVREINFAGKVTGDSFQWDGKDLEGNSLPSGKYTFRVHGVDNKGSSQVLSTELSGRVTGVDFSSGEPVLNVQTAAGQSRVDLGKVKNISSEAESNDLKKGASIPNVITSKSSGEANPEKVEVASADDAENAERPELATAEKVVEDSSSEEMPESRFMNLPTNLPGEGTFR